MLNLRFGVSYIVKEYGTHGICFPAYLENLWIEPSTSCKQYTKCWMVGKVQLLK